MFVVRFRSFQIGLMLATALSVSMLPTAGEAYTPEQQAACTDDAFRLCGSDIPDVDRVTACMVRNKDQLTPGCRAHFRSSEPEPAVPKVSAAKAVAAAAQAFSDRRRADGLAA